MPSSCDSRLHDNQCVGRSLHQSTNTYPLVYASMEPDSGVLEAHFSSKCTLWFQQTIGYVDPQKPHPNRFLEWWVQWRGGCISQILISHALIHWPEFHQFPLTHTHTQTHAHNVDRRYPDRVVTECGSQDLLASGRTVAGRGGVLLARAGIPTPEAVKPRSQI